MGSLETKSPLQTLVVEASEGPTLPKEGKYGPPAFPPNLGFEQRKSNSDGWEPTRLSHQTERYSFDERYLGHPPTRYVGHLSDESQKRSGEGENKNPPNLYHVVEVEMATKRKRKKKHLKLTAIGGHATVQFGTRQVIVTVTIPRKRLSERLT